MYYPIMMNLKGKKVIVIGGGKVAYQKLKGLENTGAKITIISPILSSQVEEWLKHQDAKWIPKEFEPPDIEKADFIFATTNNADVNHYIRKSKKAHQYLLQADCPEESDFISPSVVRRGKLTIAISTNGASPALAKKLKKELEEQFDESFACYVQFLEDARKKILKEIHDADLKKKCLNRLLDSIFYDLTMNGKTDERDALLQQIIKEASM